MNADDAIAIALEVLYQELEIPSDDEIIVTRIEEGEEGWCIECNSRRFMETDDVLYALVIAPILVHRDGSYRFVF
jgi:hypothetical protein